MPMPAAGNQVALGDKLYFFASPVAGTTKCLIWGMAACSTATASTRCRRAPPSTTTCRTGSRVALTRHGPSARRVGQKVPSKGAIEGF